MKKLIFLASMVAALLLAGSCQRENLEPVQQGNTVTYTVQMPGALATKASGDVFTLHYEVYRQNDVDNLDAKPVYEGTEDFADGVANVELEFVKDQNFAVLFWAQKAEAKVYNIADLRKVSISNTQKLLSNNFDAEVFAGTDLVENCASKKGGNVVLFRPIAQLNIATDAAGLALGKTKVVLKKSYVKVTGLSTTYNVFSGYGSSETTPAVYGMANVPTGTVTIDTKEYTYVAMNYVGFMPEDDITVDIELAIQTSEGTINHTVRNVPVKANYKTNIVGNLITATDNYSVSLSEDWEETETNLLVVNTAAGLKEAINNAKEGEEITLTGNIDLAELFPVTKSAATLPIVIPEDKSVVLNLNGYTITTPLVDGSTTNHTYAFENRGELTIKDTKGEGEIVARGIFNYGKMTLESGTINACDGNGGYGVRNYKDAEFVMNGGSIVTSNEDDHQVDKGGYDATTLRVDEGATATINGGTINNICDFTFALENYGTTTVKGGEFTSIHTTAANNGTLTIDGGSFTINGLEGVTAHALWADAGTTTINGGTFDGKDNYNGFNVCASEDAVVNIAGGKFLTVHSGSLYGKGTIDVTGGTFFDNPSARIVPGYEATQNEEGNYVVTKMPNLAKIGETAYYSLQMAIDAAEEDQTVVLVSDVVLNSSVEIDDLTYEGTQSVAINVPAGKKLTLDLNGHNIETSSTMTGEFTGGRAHVIGNLGDLTIVDNGSTKGAIISNTSDANTGGYTIFNQASLTVEGVTIVGNNGRSYALTTRGESAVTVVNNCTVYGRGGIAVEGGCNVTINGENTLCYSNETARSTSHALYIAEGNVTINAGTFESKEVYNGFVINHGAGNLTINGGNFVGHHNGETLNNCLYLSGGSTGTAVINAGTFTHGIEKAGNSTGSVVVKGGSFGQDVTKYLADGYELTENAGRYTVRQLPAAKIGETEYSTLEEAVAAAKADDTITVLCNVNLSESLTLPAGIIFNGNGKQINGSIVAGGDLTFAGHTKVTSFSASYYNRTITIGEGACLEVTGTGRATLGYGNTFNITGNIENAKTADKANVQPSLIIPAGISITGGNDAAMNVTNAYVQIGSTTSKPGAANGKFTLNFTNSIVEFSKELGFYEPTGGMNPTFEMSITNSVFTTGAKLCVAAANSIITVNNSNVLLGTYLRNSGELNITNGSVLTGKTIQFGENGGNNGIINVDASALEIVAGSTGHAFDGKETGEINATNFATVMVDYYKAMTITTDATSTFTGTKVQ